MVTSWIFWLKLGHFFIHLKPSQTREERNHMTQAKHPQRSRISTDCFPNIIIITSKRQQSMTDYELTWIFPGSVIISLSTFFPVPPISNSQLSFSPRHALISGLPFSFFFLFFIFLLARFFLWDSFLRHRVTSRFQMERGPKSRGRNS